MSRMTYTHKFVKAFPERLEEGILYVSVEFATAAHRCFCGCGSEVYTRFSPTDWSLKFDGQQVSIKPSIGNWSFKCQSHYILDGGRVNWADRWSRERIELGRHLDRKHKEQNYKGQSIAQEPTSTTSAAEESQSLLTRLFRWLAGT